MLNVLQAETRTLELHVHEDSDEMFHLVEDDFIIIPKGTLHRPVCKELVKCLLIEMKGTLNKGNTGGTYKENVK